MNSKPYQAASFIAKILPDFKPKLAIVGGYSDIGDSLTDVHKILYDDLPGFPKINVDGHKAEMLLGYLNGLPVVCLKGRSHTYECNSHEPVINYVRTLKLLGCEYYLATNASGSLRPEIGPGSLVSIRDHINLQPSNPLVGENINNFGPRFPALDPAYDLQFKKMIQDSAYELDINISEGIYISVLGPSFETAAEISAYRFLGADVIGMSTVPEVIVANHCGMKVAVISVITNLATGLSSKAHDHKDVMKKANDFADNLNNIISSISKKLVLFQN